MRISILGVALALTALLGMSLVACSSSPTPRAQDRDSGPDEIVGAPPEEGSEDYEFAMPPQNPGTPANRWEAPQEAFDPSSDEIDRRYVERLLSFGPSIVPQHVDVEPVHVDGEFLGFEIVELSSTAKGFLEPRIQQGDVITHINLVRLERPGDYIEAWQTLDEGDQVRVDLVREGEAEDVIWNVR